MAVCAALGPKAALPFRWFTFRFWVLWFGCGRVPLTLRLAFHSAPRARAALPVLCVWGVDRSRGWEHQHFPEGMKSVHNRQQPTTTDNNQQWDGGL